MKLSKAQQEAWYKIRHFVIGSPCQVQPTVFMPDKEYVSKSGNYTWKPGLIYGYAFNTATIKCLEKKGLIKIHEIGGAQGSDVIEILVDVEQDKNRMNELYKAQAVWAK